jgi:hypothetical protein
LKRLFVILSILFLFGALMVNQAVCWISPARRCSANVSAVGDRCHKAILAQSAKCGGGACNIEHQTRRASRKFAETNDIGNCGRKKDCGSRCYRLLPPLIADGPNRTTPLNSGIAESGTVAFQSILTAALYIKTSDAIPPWGIHPSIATTVLRI